MSSSLQLNWMGIENKWVVPTNLTLEVWSVLRSDPSGIQTSQRRRTTATVTTTMSATPTPSLTPSPLKERA